MTKFQILAPTKTEIRVSPIYRIPTKLREFGYRIEALLNDECGELTQSEVNQLRAMEDRLSRDALILECAFLAIDINIDPDREHEIQIVRRQTEKQIAKQKEKDKELLTAAAKAHGFIASFQEQPNVELNLAKTEKPNGQPADHVLELTSR